MIAYICQSCAGRLELNNEKTVYTCVSCGNTYDYKFFEGLELIDNASEACSRGEFVSAVSMLDFLLKKEPDNYKALYKKALAECRINDTKSLTADNLIKNNAKLDLDSYRAVAPEEHMEFFNLLGECLDLVKNISNRKTQIKQADSRLTERKRESSRRESEMQSYYMPIKSSKYGPTEYVTPQEYIRRNLLVSIGIVIMGVVLTLPAWIEDPSTALGLIVSMIIVSGIYFGITYAIATDKLRRYKDAENRLNEANIEKGKVTKEISDLEALNAKDRGLIANKIFHMKKHMI